MSYLNHHSRGYETIRHKGKDIVVSVTSPEFIEFTLNLKNKPFQIGFIPAGYEHRADLISDIFYETPVYDWLICMYNSISDPFNELNLGDRILIPSI